MKGKKLKIGLALGSGSARGYAHVGVICALKKKIKFDFVCGSSMGAVVGGIYACGSDLERTAKVISEIEQRRFWDVTIPRQGFVRGQRICEILRLLTKNMDFSQTVIPFCAVACDLVSGKPVYIREGKVYEAIRASLSIPGVFEPVRKDGMVLVDGGVLERVPVTPLRDMGADFVIAVDVGYNGQERMAPKNTVDIIMGTLDVMSWEMTRHKVKAANALICPDVQGIPPYSFGKMEEFIEAGRVAGEAALDGILEKIELAEAEIGG